MIDNWLFPIQLKGIGSEDIECLPSYLIRSASAHGITPGQLLSHAVTNYAGFKQLPIPTIAGQPGSINHYVRPNNTTDLLVRSLVAGSGLNHFRQSTFLSLQFALDRSVFAFANNIRWCPVCIAEFQKTGERSYFKLIWQLNAISHCHTHSVPLLFKCPTCCKTQNSWRRRQNCGLCVHCKSSLGHEVDSGSFLGSAKSDSGDLVLLVREIASTPELHYPNGGVRNVLNTIFDTVWNREEELALWKRLSRDEYLRLSMGDEPVTLETARKVAFKLGLSLADLLSGQVLETTKLLDPAWTENLPPALKPVRRRQHRDRQKLLAGLRSALALPVADCLSLRAVAKKIKVSPSCLEHQFPTFSEEVKKKYALRREKEAVQKTVQIHAAVSRYFASAPSLRNFSKKRALREIRKSTGLPKEPLRKAIAELYDEIARSGRHSGSAT